MALASRTFRRIHSLSRTTSFSIQRKWHGLNVNHSCKLAYRSYSNDVQGKAGVGSQAPRGKRDPASFFFHDEVQSCLLEMNMRDTSKVFEPRKEGQTLVDPEIRFLTQEELEMEQAKAMEIAKYYLQLPPVLSVKEDKLDILAKDPALQGVLDTKILFTDISFGIPHNERLIVARDTDGTLRHASREERRNMIQIYFPEEGRSVGIPELFSPQNLQSLWERSEFEFVLDKACMQFEPDDPEYVSITSATYDYIDENEKYDELVGTRHFGSMAFYLIFNNRFDKFLKHCISTFKIKEAILIVKVFYLTRPDIKEYKQVTSMDDTEFIQEYITKHSKDKASLSMALNAYLELNLPSADEEARMSKPL